MEMCEDLQPLLDKLRDCRLPVALQAFAGHSATFPKSWVPLSVVAPLTEFSALLRGIRAALNFFVRGRGAKQAHQDEEMFI